MSKPSRSRRAATDACAEENSRGLYDRFFHGDQGLPFVPASQAGREDLLGHCIGALQTSSSFDIVAAEIQQDGQEMIRVRLESRNAVPSEFLQIDLRNLWKNTIAKAKTSLHVVRLTQSGFDFRFSILDEGVFVTGVFIVTVPTPDDRI